MAAHHRKGVDGTRPSLLDLPRGEVAPVLDSRDGAPFLDLEFDSRLVLGLPAARAFARGYFDADGGMPQRLSARIYVPLTQKNRLDLDRLRALLEAEGISCGRIHNPSVRVDPGYWRFFIRARSHTAFLSHISSWHPLKRALMEDRLKQKQCELARG
ncbi:MAG: LAGLIDADG family homing endonuclease [Actinomycetota bacterium]